MSDWFNARLILNLPDFYSINKFFLEPATFTFAAFNIYLWKKNTLNILPAP